MDPYKNARLFPFSSNVSKHNSWLFFDGNTKVEFSLLEDNFGWVALCYSFWQGHSKLSVSLSSSVGYFVLTPSQAARTTSWQLNVCLRVVSSIKINFKTDCSIIWDLCNYSVENWINLIHPVGHRLVETWSYIVN